MISVGIWGNNLNQGYFLAELFRELGARAKVFLVESALPQDRHAWWTAGPLDESLVVRVPEAPPLGAPGDLVRLDAVRRLYEQAREFDVLIVREDGPALFSELPDPPRVFAAQGADLQLWPFWMEVFYSPVAIARQLSAAWRDGVAAFGRRAIGLARSWPSLRRTQARQRRGLARCGRVIVFPYQQWLLDRLAIGAERTRFVPVPGALPDRIHVPAGAEALPPGLMQRLAEPDVLFLHPARQFFLQEDGNRFLKDNDKLIRAFARFVPAATRSVRLALVEKGRPRDLAVAKALVERLGLTPHVVWLPELPNYALRTLFRLPNLVVCDQFSPFVNAMGNIGRESAFFGVPLITSYDGADDRMYTRRPPHVLMGNSDDTVLQSLAAAAALDATARQRLREDCTQWSRENLDPLQNAARYLEVCREALAAGRTEAP